MQNITKKIYTPKHNMSNRQDNAYSKYGANIKGMQAGGGIVYQEPWKCHHSGFD